MAILAAVPAFLAANAAAVSAASAGVTAASALYGGIAQSQAASYQAKVAENNAQIARQNAQYSIEAGDEKAQQAGLRAAEEGGAIKTSLAANNVDVNTGSAVDVEAATKEKGRLNELMTAEDAELAAYGYKSTATSEEAQAGLDTATAENAIPGAAIGAVGNALSSASSLGFKWTGAQPASPYENTTVGTAR
jgi:hypothetical protein